MDLTLLHRLHHTFLAQTQGGGQAPPAEPDEVGAWIELLLPWAKWVGIAVGALIILLIIRRILSGSSAPRLQGKYDRGTRKVLKDRLQAGDWAGAGDLAYQNQAFDEAAEIYMKGNLLALAAEAYAAGGKKQQAIALFKRAKLPQRAAEIYESSGQLRAAANEYLACNDQDRAARLFFKAKDFRRAGEVYQELRRWKEAGEAFERLGLKAEAAEMYERYFQEEYEIARANLDSIPDAVSKGHFAAAHFRTTGDLDRAAKLFERCGDLSAAGQTLADANDLDGAAALFIRARKPDAAARLYEKVGNAEKAAECRGEALLLKGDVEGAAIEFVRAQKYTKAAEAFTDAGQRLRAAEAWVKAQDFRMAAELFLLEDKPDVAARCFEKAGDFERAGQLFRKLGDREAELRNVQQARDWFRLGQLLVELSRFEEALAALQKVDNLHDRWETSCELQGDLLRRMGRYDVAASKYRLGIGNAEPSPGNLALFYKLAVCQQEAGQDLQALQSFERVLAVDFYYKDAQERFNALQGRVVQSGAMPAMTLAARSTGPTARSRVTGANLNPPMPMPSAAAIAVRTSTHPGAPMRYEIIDELARGGMGIVYRARDTVLGRTVAFKILSDALKGNATAVEYFLREAQAAAALQHPNIVTVFDAGEQAGEYYMAMEFVDGKTIKALIAEQGPFHEKLVRFVILNSCKGLAYAHSQGIVHRDIKSGNMMIARDKTLKIMDFGLAKFVQEYQSQHTKAIGTPFYMSPEQILGHNLDHRSDLYSLGVTIFECATGTVPFYRGEMAYHHLHTAPPSPRSLNPRISEAMEHMILKLLEKNPADRYQSADDVVRALKT